MLPDRSVSLSSSGGRTGDQYLAEIAALSGKAREDKTLEYVRERWLPDSLQDFARWPTITIKGPDAAGVAHVLSLQVSPTGLRVGVNEETAALAGMWPTTSQKVADELGLRTIGKKIARASYEQALVKGSLYLSNPGEPFYDLKTGTPRNIEDSKAWAASDKKRQKWLAAQVPLSRRGITLVRGDAKDVVQQASALASGKKVPGSQLAIYGGGGGKNDGWAIQPFPGPHAWNYGPDYSHQTAFARNRVMLDGKVDKLDRIVADPNLSLLVSEAGPFNNRMSFPPTGFSLEGDAEDEIYLASGRAGDSDEVAAITVSDSGAEPEAVTMSSFFSNLIWPWGPIGLVSVGMVWAARRGIPRAE